jgi:RNA polymerase sigma-70 factor (ECF subfamily)
LRSRFAATPSPDKPTDLGDEQITIGADRDLALARRIAAGDAAALGELIERHGQALRRLVGRLCAWSDDCDDVMQEVLLRVWERSHSFRGGSLAAWLRQVAINECRRRHRSLGVAKRLFARFRERHVPPTERPVASRLEAAELTRIALRQLRHDERTLVVLFYLEGLSLEAIGELLHVRPATLAVRLHRARERMGARLRAEIDGEAT